VARTTASTFVSARSALKSFARVSFCASAKAVTSGDTVRVAPATNRITWLSL
jgi:hypothetical protein